jgi:Carboxypeptidase regulatory-like domain
MIGGAELPSASVNFRVDGLRGSLSPFPGLAFFGLPRDQKFATLRGDDEPIQRTDVCDQSFEFQHSRPSRVTRPKPLTLKVFADAAGEAADLQVRRATGSPFVKGAAMNRYHSPRFLAVIIAALCISLVAVSVFAQVETGNIYGRVQGKDGGVLPGVTVTLTGIAAPQTTVSDAQGNFRFIGLSPGTYALKAELAGLGTSTRNGIGVNLGRNADVTMTLNPTVAESITVTAGTPLLDVRKTGSGADVSHVELDKVPTARDPWVILQQTPGVLMDRINVGGNQSGQQSGYVSKGSVAAQSTWNVDGVNITDFAATGSSPSYYDFDSFEEMQITTAGTDPRIQTPGVQINMVTKRGTNDYKGSAHAFHTSQSYQATPKIPAEAASYLTNINQINKIDDDGGEIGGPILKDRLWFWGAYGKQKIDILTASLLVASDPNSRFQDRTQLTNENLKVNAQPIASNSLTLVDQYGAKVKLGRNVSSTRFPEAGWNQNDTYAHGTGSLKDPTLWKIEDTQIIGQNFYLTGLYSKVQGGFQLIADNGKGCVTFACGVDSLPAYRDFAGDGAWHRSYETIDSLRPQKQTRLDGSAFANTGSISHELKFGFGTRNADVTSHSAWPVGQFVYNYGSGSRGDGKDSAEVALMRFPNFTFSAKSTDAYIGDTMLFGNLTVQGGLRYDIQKGSDSAGSAVANPVVPDLIPAITFGSSSGLKWSNISPRLGLTYAVGANRQTLLRAGYSRYVNQLDSGSVFPTSPGATSYLYYYFNDLNKDNIAQRSEIDFLYGLAGFRGIDPGHPSVSQQFTRWASNFKAPTTDEIVLGVEHELLTDFSVGVNGTYRKLNDFVWTIGEKHQGQGDYYTSADYVLHAPATGTLPNGTKVSLPYYVLKSGTDPATFNVITNRPDYYQNYKGLELTATKRMSNRWMLRGNFTFSDWKQHVGPGAIVDPTVLRSGSGSCSVCNNTEVLSGSGTGSGAFGGVYINSKWAYSLTGAYQIPIIESSFGFNINGRQGYPLPYVVRVGAGAEGNKFLLAENQPDQFRNPNVREVDIRLAKEIRIARAGLTLSIDGFNMLNSNTTLQRNVARLGVTASNRITEDLSPRVFRLGARFSFN